MSAKTITVLVVDDHPIVRRGLIAEINLNTLMRVVGEAKDGLEAIELAASLQPDVILMDLVMPELNGVQATEAILKNNPAAKILILTSFTEEENIYAAIAAGANGFIFKDQHPEQVLKAILDVYNGIPVLNAAITTRLMRNIQKTDNELDVHEELTERELEVLRYVVLGKPYKLIAREMGVRQTTIRAHVSNILGKLNLVNRSQLVLYAIQEKLINPDTL